MVLETHTMHSMEQIIGEHPFFAGIDTAYLRLISSCATNVRFEPGRYVLRHGESAERFYLLRHGRAVLELSAAGRGTLTFQTIGPGELIGVSWLIPPYRWTYDAKALELIRAIAVDAACLRGKCEQDHHLGYELMKRFMPVLIQRLQAARLQLLDVYGTHA